MNNNLSHHLMVLEGGNPAFKQKVHVGRPNIGSREKLMKRIEDILDRRWLSNDGVYVREFEAEVARRLGASECVAVCNGTVGLEIATRALNMKGDVVVPSWTFIATPHSLQWQGLSPIFCDVEESHNICPRSLEAALDSRCGGIVGVHLWGRPARVYDVAEVAKNAGVPLVWDASHALGTCVDGKAIGNFGDAEVFSFHATKIANAFEGGLVATNNCDLAQKMRLMRNFGFAGYDDVVYNGTNGKMNEVCGAMGLTSLESLDEFISINRRNYAIYLERLNGLPGVDVLIHDEENSNFQYVVTQWNEESPLSRDEMMQVLWAENIMARRYFWPGCHAMRIYKDTAVRVPLPFTEKLAAQVLVLPTGTALDANDIHIICDVIRTAYERAGDIKKCLF